MKYKKKSGQAAVEYVLLVAFMTLIFGSMFALVRNRVYKLWVCEIGPRVQSPSGCSSNYASCFDSLQESVGADSQVPPACTP